MKNEEFAAAMTRYAFRMMHYVLLVAFLSSCVEENKGKVVTGAAQSAPYELLVVANKEWLKTQTGKALMDVVESSIEGLPQNEPNFKCIKIDPVRFNSTFKVYANILWVEIGSKYQTAEMRIARDLYCRPQLIVSLYAPDDAALALLLQERREQILGLFNEQEFSRERQRLSKKHSGVVSQQAEKQFGVKINAPADIRQVKAGKDFFWASTGNQDFKLNICLYTLPLQNLSFETFAAVRDSVMRVNIPGGHEGQWMETDARTLSYNQRTDPESGALQMVVRGLWDMKGDAMGGPFVSYIQLDTLNERLLVSEGFVFAPNKKKRALIRELEAALQSVELK